MINRFNACAYNTSVIPRKIYCTYFYIFNIFTYTKCANVARCRSQGGVRGNAGRGRDPRLSASQIVIYRNGRSESGLIHHHDFSLPRGEKSFTRSLLRPSRCSRHVSALLTLFRDKCTRNRHKKKCSESGIG